MRFIYLTFSCTLISLNLPEGINLIKSIEIHVINYNIFHAFPKGNIFPQGKIDGFMQESKPSFSFCISGRVNIALFCELPFV